MVSLLDSSDKYIRAEQPRLRNLLPQHVARTEPAPDPVLSEDSFDEELSRRVLDVRQKPECVPRLKLDEKVQVNPSGDNSKAQPHKEQKYAAKVTTSVLELHQENNSGSQLHLPIARPTLSLELTLSPVKQCKGRPTLLRPLYEKKERLLQGSAVQLLTESTTIKHSSEGNLPSNSDEMKESLWEKDYVDWETVQVRTTVPCHCYRSTKAGSPYFICEYQQDNLQELRWKRGQTAWEGLLNFTSVLPSAKHKHVVPLHEIRYSPQKDRICLIYRFHFSCCLMQLAPLEESAALHAFSQVLEAIAYFHSTLNMVLNDLSPWSFVVDAAGNVKLHWISAASQKTTASSTSADLIRAVAILYLLIYSTETDAESQFEILVDLFTQGRGQIAFPSACSKRLQGLFTLTRSKRHSLCLSDLSLP